MCRTLPIECCWPDNPGAVVLSGAVQAAAANDAAVMDMAAAALALDMRLHSQVSPRPGLRGQ